MLANVPGTVAGMHSAWKQFGSKKVPWADLLAPAIRAAKDGYVVSEGLATTLTVEREHFSKYESSKALFFRNGEPLHAGDTLKNPDLAWTLEQIAKGGADGFYSGEVARRMVTDLRGKGNAMRLTDLARYFAADREPVSSTYRGYTLYSSAPPVSGGATLAAQLNLLEQWKTPRVYTEDAATAHAMIAAWQLTPTTRNRIADPGLWPVTVEPLVNKDTARVRWRCFDPAHALTPARSAATRWSAHDDRKATTDGERRTATMRARHDLALEDGGACGNAAEHAREVAACHSSGTTAFTVADADGNVVAVTQTLGTWGGNFYVVARARLHLQRQAHVVRHRPVAVRRSAPVRAARQHARADDRVPGHRQRAPTRCSRSARRATRGSRRRCTRRSSACSTSASRRSRRSSCRASSRRGAGLVRAASSWSTSRAASRRRRCAGCARWATT